MFQKCLLLFYLLGLSFELAWPTRWSFQAARVTLQNDNRPRDQFSCHYIPPCFCGTSTRKTRIPQHLALAAVVQDDVALQTLGLKGPGSPEEIKRAFRRKVIEMHPDRLQGGSSKLNDQRFRDILDAYARLTGKAPALRSERKVGGKPKSPAKSAADAEQWYAKDASRARWSQETGYNPSDLESVWDDIGYNPYTGEYHAPKASDTDWQQEVDWQPPSAPSVTTASSDAAQRVAKSAARSPRSGKARPTSAGDEDEVDVRMQILTYTILVIACIIAALVPNLFSGQNLENRFRSAPPPPAIRRSGPPPTIQRSVESQRADEQKSESQPRLSVPTGNEATSMAYNTIQQPEDDWSVEDFEARQAAEIQRWVDQFGFRKRDLKLEPEIASKLRFRE